MKALAQQVATDTGDGAYRQGAAHDASLPYHVIEMTDSDPNRHQGGRSGFALSTVAIESFNTTPEAAEAKADTIEAALDGKSQSIGTAGDAINVSAFQTGRTDNVLAPRDASRAFIYSVRMSFDFWHPV
jgi:hypothetical protein